MNIKKNIILNRKACEMRVYKYIFYVFFSLDPLLPGSGSEVRSGSGSVSKLGVVLVPDP